MSKLFIKIFIIVSIFSLVSCTEINNQESITNNVEAEVNFDFASELLNQRKETAFEAYVYALEKAYEWNGDAILYEIPSTVITSENIGLPAPGFYWFFMFSTENSPREYYIAISDGDTAGTFEAEPLIFEDLPYKLNPINISNLIDSDKALALCVENGLIIPNEVIENNKFIDYRLINLGDNPVWSLFLTKSDPYLPICNIDAVTGQLTNDPYLAIIQID